MLWQQDPDSRWHTVLARWPQQNCLIVVVAAAAGQLTATASSADHQRTADQSTLAVTHTQHTPQMYFSFFFLLCWEMLPSVLRLPTLHPLIG